MNHKIEFILVLACIVACSMGCNDANRSKIVGTWTIEQADRVMSRVNNADELLTDSSNENTQPIREEDTPEPRMILMFQSNGTMKTKTNMGSVVQEKIGTWKMLNFDSETDEMKIEFILQQQKSEHEVSFVEDGLIKLVPPNMAGLKMKLKFRRQ